MKKLLLILFISGCCWPFNTESKPATFHEETFLPYKQPSRDHGYPRMQTLRADDDGYFELQRGGGKWGVRRTVRIRSKYNSVSQHTSQSIAEVISEVEELPKGFRLYAISKAFFAPSKRAFIDDRKFDCGSVCETLDQKLESGERFDMIMSFGNSADELFVDKIEEASCYSSLDCRAREVCCVTKAGDRCVEDNACDGKHYGYSREFSKSSL